MEKIKLKTTTGIGLKFKHTTPQAEVAPVSNQLKLLSDKLLSETAPVVHAVQLDNTSSKQLLVHTTIPVLKTGVIKRPKRKRGKRGTGGDDTSDVHNYDTSVFDNYDDSGFAGFGGSGFDNNDDYYFGGFGGSGFGGDFPPGGGDIIKPTANRDPDGRKPHVNYFHKIPKSPKSQSSSSSSDSEMEEMTITEKTNLRADTISLEKEMLETKLSDTKVTFPTFPNTPASLTSSFMLQKHLPLGNTTLQFFVLGLIFVIGLTSFFFNPNSTNK